MARTKHFKQRMLERAITDDMVDLVRQYCEPNQDKIVLGRNALDRLLVAVRQLEYVSAFLRQEKATIYFKTYLRSNLLDSTSIASYPAKGEGCALPGPVPPRALCTL